MLGISADTVESHDQFAINNELPFILLSDKDNAVRKRYGVPKVLGIMPGRATYVIDRQGIVVQIITGIRDTERHVQESLRAVRAMAI